MSSPLTSCKILSATCPAENCKATLIYSESFKEVECWSCKVNHPVTALNDVSPIVARGDAILAAMKVILKAPVRPERPVTKVLGLSTYHCKLLSPLLTVYGIDKMGRAKTIHELKNCATFDCSWLSDRSFCIEPHHINIPGYGQDESGSTHYLSGTLSLLRSFNSNRDALIPLHVDGDGHCLVHAISRAIVGRELFWHALRTGLKLHLTENLPRYKELLSDFINASEWEDIIAECDPDYAPHDNEMLGLRNIHIFGLANVLHRPVLLVDSVAGMQSSGDYSALFLPGLIAPDQCRDKNGELHKPICLAWSSSGRNHYIPLVGIKGGEPPLFPRSLLPKVWGVSQAMIDKYIEFNQRDCLVIGGGRMMQDAYLLKLVSGMNALYHQKFGIDPSLVADTYYSNFRKAAAFDTKPSEVLSATKTALQERRLARCLGCESVNMLPLNSEWLRPHGLLYNIAKTRSAGRLVDQDSYTFFQYGVTCVYDARKDMLVVEKSTNLDRCSWCGSDQLRPIHFDGSVLYENGDKTPTIVNSPRTRCKCGFKHWFNGREYDNPPLKVPVAFEWKSRAIKEEVLWFQDESDPSLNSDPYQMSSFIVHKYFPGEKDVREVRQLVLKILFEKTKSSVLNDIHARTGIPASQNLDQAQTKKCSIQGKNSQDEGHTLSTRDFTKSRKSACDSQNSGSTATPKKRHSDCRGGTLPKQRSTPASLAAAAAISRAGSKQNPHILWGHTGDKGTPMKEKEGGQHQIIRLGPGYSVIADANNDQALQQKKYLDDIAKASELYASLFASFVDPDVSAPRRAVKGSDSLLASGSGPNDTSKKKKKKKVNESTDSGCGSLSRVANLLNVGGDQNLSDCEELRTDSDGESGM